MTKERVDERQVLRPTEAQLRWAQFHRKTRAQSVQEKLERLWQTPASPSNVPDALSDDGVTTDESSTSPKKRREKPKISRGRRAMLRVSKRAYEKRRINIIEHGYHCSEDKENEAEDDEEDAVIAMFAEESVRKKRRKRRATLRHRAEDEEERFRRFEEAMNAMMMNLMPQEQPEISVTPGKRWTRSTQVPVGLSIDGRQYDDLKWGFTARKGTHVQNSAVGMPATAPFDRRASWLVHLPARHRSSRRLSFGPAMSSNGEVLHPENLSGEPVSFFSPGQMKFDELVDTLRQRELANAREHGQNGTPAGQREARGKAAKFREWYSRRHSSDRIASNMPDEDSPEGHCPPTDVDGFPLSPDGNHSEADSQGDMSYGNESEFWRSARNMHDTVPVGMDTVAEDYLPGSFRSRSKGSMQAGDAESSGRAREPSPESPEQSPGGESEFWQRARNMHHTTPLTDAAPGEHPFSALRKQLASEEHPRGVRTSDSESTPSDSDPAQQSQVMSPHMDSEGFVREKQLNAANKTSPLPATGSIVQQRLQSMGGSFSGSKPSSPSELSQTMSKLPNEKLEPFKEKLSPSPGEGQAQSGRKIQASASADISKSPDGDFVIRRRADSDSMVRRRAQEMEGALTQTSPSEAPKTAQKLPQDKFDLFEEKTPPTVNGDSMVRRRAQEMESALTQTSPSEAPKTAQKLPRDMVDQFEETTSPVAANDSQQEMEGALTQTSPSETRKAAPKLPKDKVDLSEEKAPPAVLRIGSKVGGMFNNMFGGQKGADANELAAVAAFKKTQDDRRASNDDATSTSSYRILPEGIRRVVKNFATGKGNPVTVQPEDDDILDDDAAAASELKPRTSPIRSAASGQDEFSPEHGKFIHQRVMEKSALIGEADGDAFIIDTDDTTSEATMDARLAASLFLSPAILTKRLHQAIRAIERHNWDQLSYLLSANPWLAEMTDVTTGQYLLHKLALYGAGVAVLHPETGDVVQVEAPAAPEELSLNLIRMFPASVHKFDQDGNLPLHMAAVSGYQDMIGFLGERFPSGASVRNEEGLLPLHMAIQSCSSPAPSADGSFTSPSSMIKTILGFFPGAVAVPDNDGNLPIHCAADALHGDLGVDVIYMLFDEADRQVENGLRFRGTEQHHSNMDDDGSESMKTDITAASVTEDSEFCNLVRNDMGWTPLMVAIRAMAGWEVIEAIASGPGGMKATLHQDADRSNALHLLVSGEFADPPSILSVLRIAPEAATVQNSEGMLPIEVSKLGNFRQVNGVKSSNFPVCYCRLRV